ncbi:hypothetical protein [Arthrobacter sp. Soil763]|uniref:hypothetical protein n=1 Tax=Arthrobacter sp. Soil763 TaxID=1736402 RepID=UPI0012FB0DED|nr:hypothetical protein [Arthrobacter sp. Soil763]
MRENGTERVTGSAQQRAEGVKQLEILAPAGWINSNQRLHRMQVAKLTAAWREAARVRVPGSWAPAVGPVRVVAEVWKPRRGRYDPGNLYPTAKAVLDGIVDAGLLSDDDWLHVVGPDMRHGGIGPAALVVKIYPANALSVLV